MKNIFILPSIYDKLETMKQVQEFQTFPTIFNVTMKLIKSMKSIGNTCSQAIAKKYFSIKEIENILKQFSPVSLKEMDGVKLMNRTDTKFTFKLDLLPQLLNEIKPFYKCLNIGSCY